MLTIAGMHSSTRVFQSAPGFSILLNWMKILTIAAWVKSRASYQSKTTCWITREHLWSTNSQRRTSVDASKINHLSTCNTNVNTRTRLLIENNLGSLLHAWPWSFALYLDLLFTNSGKTFRFKKCNLMWAKWQPLISQSNWLFQKVYGNLGSYIRTKKVLKQLSGTFW